VPILSNELILEQFKTRKQRFCEWRTSSGWIYDEVRESFAVYEGESSLESSWGYTDEGALAKRRNNSQPCLAINKTAPVLDAVCGFQIQNRTEVEYTPRSMSADESTDVVNNGLEYILSLIHI
jgi:hypothetical protein